MADKNIIITFPDGNKKNFDIGTTGYDVAHSISPALAEQALAVVLNDKVCDLSLPINEDVSISILKRAANESLE